MWWLLYITFILYIKGLFVININIYCLSIFIKPFAFYQFSEMQMFHLLVSVIFELAKMQQHSWCVVYEQVGDATVDHNNW